MRMQNMNTRKEESPKSTVGKKDVCAAGEDVDELPEQVFISISEKLEDRMLENNGDLEYSVVQEVVNEFWEQEGKRKMLIVSQNKEKVLWFEEPLTLWSIRSR